MNLTFAPKAAEQRYKADIAAGSLKLRESRHIAALLLKGVNSEEWREAIVTNNVLQAKNLATAERFGRLIRARLETMGPELWTLVRDGSGTVATHAVFAAAVKHSRLLRDFLALVVADQYRTFRPALSHKLFDDYLDGCRERDPEMPQWQDVTRRRVRSSVFQMLAQAGYLDSTRSLNLQTVHVADQVVRYLTSHDEKMILRCLQVSP